MAQNADGVKVFSQIIKADKCPDALMILCPDLIRREGALQKILECFKLTAAEKINISIANSDSATLTELKYRGAEISLFSKEKIIIFKDVQTVNADKTDTLMELLENNSGSKIIFLGTSLTAISRLYKYFAGKNLLINLPELKNNELLRWLEKKAAAQKITLDEKALNILAQICANSADTASRMLEQAALYSDNGTITATELLNLFPAEASADSFKLIDLINARQLAAAELELHSILKSGSSHFQLLGLLHSHYFKIFLLSLGIKNGHSGDNLARHLKINPYVISKYLAVARANTPEKLKSKLAEILRTDSIFKNRSLGDENAFSMLLAKLAA